MIRDIGIALFIFGLFTVVIGAFYKLFLHDRKRSLLFPKYNTKKESFVKEIFKIVKFSIGLDINFRVWIGIVYIVIMIFVLFTILFVKYFMPEYFSTNFMTDVGDLINKLFRR